MLRIHPRPAFEVPLLAYNLLCCSVGQPAPAPFGTWTSMCTGGSGGACHTLSAGWACPTGRGHICIFSSPWGPWLPGGRSRAPVGSSHSHHRRVAKLQVTPRAAAAWQAPRAAPAPADGAVCLLSVDVQLIKSALHEKRAQAVSKTHSACGEPWRHVKLLGLRV